MDTRFFARIDDAITALLSDIPGRLILGTPLGIGKPNPFLNALYQRVHGSSRQLDIFTALSLNKPVAGSELEARFLEPFVARVFGDYPDLDYLRDLKNGTLPDNITVNEFFLKSGEFLGNDNAQQHYISSNYTHIARDMNARGVNVLVQAVAARNDNGFLRLSLSCNPDVAPDLMEHIALRREAGEAIRVIAVINDALPFMGHEAEIDSSLFDYVITDPAGTHTLFSTPNMKVGSSDYAIGLHASALVTDGGTLQIGIGSLGDAIAHALILRQHHNADYRQLLRSLNQGQMPAYAQTDALATGLYGCSEMFVNGFMKLIQAGVIRRRVYPDARLQQLLNEHIISENVSAHTLDALIEHGIINTELDGNDIDFLLRSGIFNEHCSFEDGQLYAGEQIIGNDLSDEQIRLQITRHCLGEQLSGGVILHGGFFLGPRDFYQALHDFSEAEREQIAMSRITFINQLNGNPPHKNTLPGTTLNNETLKRAQRRHARFINTCMMVTLSGAAVSDGLDSGKMVSGVGGQYNFVAQAHELPDARSILMLRSHRISEGEARSNIVPHYGHITIPRHLRDIVITEYGIADLRAKNDSEVIQALIAIADSRFQEELRSWAVAQGKLPAAYVIPEQHRHNTPEQLAERLTPFKAQLPAFPFGCDFTDDELVIIKALTALKAGTENPLSLMRTVISALLNDKDVPERYLERMGLDDARSLKEKLLRRLFVGNL